MQPRGEVRKQKKQKRQKSKRSKEVGREASEKGEKIWKRNGHGGDVSLQRYGVVAGARRQRGRAKARPYIRS
jgi:hypothetical protein